MAEKIRTMVIDDSAVVRQTLKGVLESDPAIEVVATASDPYIAARKLQSADPDVITLDIEMPKMDGISFLKRLMAQQPLPVVICSSQAQDGSDNAIRALEYGAVDIIQKPRVGTKAFFEESKTRICDVVKAAHASRVKPKKKKKVAPEPTPGLATPKQNADAVIAWQEKPAIVETTQTIVVVGASTGGTEAVRSFLEAMPLDSPGIVVVQHMPEQFTAAFAQRLDALCRLTVKEAANNDTVIRGRALIAPGNRHCLLKRSGARYLVQITDGPLVSRHRPSVDVLFRSAARYAGKNAIGVIMTGMGDDGAQGLLEMKQMGAHTIAQDEASCVVYGMPNEAVKRGAVEAILPLQSIPQHLVSRTAKA